MSPLWAKAVKHHLVDKGWTVVRLANEARISKSHLSEALAGKARPTPIMIAKISMALDLSPIQCKRLNHIAARFIGWNIQPFDITREKSE